MDSFCLQKVCHNEFRKVYLKYYMFLYNVIWQTPLLTHPAMSTWFMNDPKSSWVLVDYLAD